MDSTTFFWIFLIIVVFIFGPLLSIWSVNTLFELQIRYDIDTWFAALVLSGALGGAIKAGK